MNVKRGGTVLLFANDDSLKRKITASKCCLRLLAVIVVGLVGGLLHNEFLAVLDVETLGQLSLVCANEHTAH